MGPRQVVERPQPAFSPPLLELDNSPPQRPRGRASSLSIPASHLLKGGFSQLPDEEGTGVTNVSASNSVLEAWVGTREKGVAEVGGEGDERASNVMPPQNVPPEIAV